LGIPFLMNVYIAPVLLLEISYANGYPGAMSLLLQLRSERRALDLFLCQQEIYYHKLWCDSLREVEFWDKAEMCSIQGAFFMPVQHLLDSISVLMEMGQFLHTLPSPGAQLQVDSDLKSFLRGLAQLNWCTVAAVASGARSFSKRSSPIVEALRPQKESTDVNSSVALSHAPIATAVPAAAASDTSTLVLHLSDDLLHSSNPRSFHWFVHPRNWGARFETSSLSSARQDLLQDVARYRRKLSDQVAREKRRTELGESTLEDAFTFFGFLVTIIIVGLQEADSVSRVLLVAAALFAAMYTLKRILERMWNAYKVPRMGKALKDMEWNLLIDIKNFKQKLRKHEKVLKQRAKAAASVPSPVARPAASSVSLSRGLPLRPPLNPSLSLHVPPADSSRFTLSRRRAEEFRTYDSATSDSKPPSDSSEGEYSSGRAALRRKWKQRRESGAQRKSKQNKLDAQNRKHENEKLSDETILPKSPIREMQSLQPHQSQLLLGP
jgi:hypothetical protein